MQPTIDDLVVFQIEGTAHWRREKGEEFPNDTRNGDAYTTLEQLASEIRALDDLEHYRLTLWKYAERDNDGRYSEILSAATRAVGFRSFPSSGREFLIELIGLLHMQWVLTFEEPEAPLFCQMLVKTTVQLEPRADAGNCVHAVLQPWYDIVGLLAKDPTVAYEIPAEKWEEIVAGAYSRAGFDEVILTPRSGDFGRDVIAIKRGLGVVRVIDQVKAYKPPRLVTANDVRALYGVLQMDGASKAFLTTTSDFAPRINRDPLIAPHIPTRLELINGKSLFERLCNIAKDSGL